MHSYTMWKAHLLKSQEWEMHISHMPWLQVYASQSFDAISCMEAGVDSWDLASVLCAHDVVTEMAVALHAIGVKCHVHHVAAKDAQ